MPGSTAFQRIKADVLAVTRRIPPGRVTTFAAVGAYLDVMPRHVAYLLALPNDVERETAPWYRIVGDAGRLGRPKRDFHGRTQAELLASEGVALTPEGVVAEFAARFHPITAETAGVVPTPRSADAARTSARRAR
jgi:methylated-DNA-protein-cysteine methyltransferase-like protein